MKLTINLASKTDAALSRQVDVLNLLLARPSAAAWLADRLVTPHGLKLSCSVITIIFVIVINYDSFGLVASHFNLWFECLLLCLPKLSVLLLLPFRFIQISF